MVQRSGILREAKQKSHFTSRSEVKRIAKAKAARRQRKRMARTLTRTRKAA
jgi:ribosomal protein S21